MAGERILIVEDDENVAQLVAFVLRREGFDPLVLRDGRAAEAHVAAEPPAAAVLLDVMLPYRDGFEVAAAMRADPRWTGVPIVALTARTLPADLERARALGIAEVVPKPFHPRAVAARLRAVVDAASAAALPDAERAAG